MCLFEKDEGTQAVSSTTSASAYWENHLKLVRFLLLFSCFGVLSCSASNQLIAEKAPSYHAGYQQNSTLANYYEQIRPESLTDELTGFHSLSTGDDALLARIALIESAQHSLDLQYYLFGDDETSNVITWRLYEAAQRGVKIRLLLDDMQRRDDKIMAMLNHHPNIEIRLFNPHIGRTSRALSFLSDFSRLNHRMHNKSMTADGVAAIVGGRNIGNEYFSFSSHVEFGDFDLLLFGPAVGETAEQFDLYWNSDQTLPVSALISLSEEETHQTLADLVDVTALEAPFKTGEYDITQLPLFEHLKRGTLELYWGEARLWYDLPEKVKTQSSQLAESLSERLNAATDSIVLISPYFVPTEAGTLALKKLVEKGIKITIITNSLASNDVFAVHGWYAKYREDLLESGIELWEMKASAEIKRQWSLIGSQRASLHAKVIVIDDADVVVGSMNWDPRSANLNTEMAVVVDHPDYAKSVTSQLNDVLPQVAFNVVIREGDIVWIDGVTQEQFDSEPEASVWRRMGAWLSGILPIEGLL